LFCSEQLDGEQTALYSVLDEFKTSLTHNKSFKLLSPNPLALRL